MTDRRSDDETKWPSSLGEPFPGETLLADGWQYRDLPGWLSLDMWEAFVGILGEENYRVLACSERAGYKRGQFLISPQGMRNLSQHVRAHDASKTGIDQPPAGTA